MDRATLIGLGLGGLALIGGHFLEGGSLGMILQLTALVIVFGGTIGAVSLSFSSSQLRQALRELPYVFREPKDEGPAQLVHIFELAYRARREGLLSLEEELEKLPDPFLRRGLQLVIDGFPAHQVREVLEMELANQGEAGQIPARVFEAAGGYAPTIGILGAVLGLIQVMQHLTEPAKLGTGVAVAFVATVYGVASANLIFLPIAHKLRLRHQQRQHLKEMALEGILALAEGDHPRLILDKLQGFLTGNSLPEQMPLPSPKVHILTPRKKTQAEPYASPSTSSQ
ncbi:MAG: hypothetical protein A2Y80_07385 [Deltaproteobacteria bacterium RBG_13_58_19]|nr:MAG: hypothetical protein A2Y80_07385 [Deltaproteobacteria bacterium RBG_13_58_19]